MVWSASGICGPQIDLFNSDSQERVVGVSPGQGALLGPSPTASVSLCIS